MATQQSATGRQATLAAVGFLVLAVAGIVLLSHREAGTGANNSSGPWTSAQLEQPEDLLRELADPNHANRPIVVCVGFGTLFRSAHIPGAVFHGSAATPQGLADLKAWAQDIPRSKTVVLYCGCCPFSRCPTVQPAFQTLNSMGFTHLKVLSIPTDFATDWVEKGYPIEKGR